MHIFTPITRIVATKIPTFQPTCYTTCVALTNLASLCRIAFLHGIQCHKGCRTTLSNMVVSHLNSPRKMESVRSQSGLVQWLDLARCAGAQDGFVFRFLLAVSSFGTPKSQWLKCIKRTLRLEHASQNASGFHISLYCIVYEWIFSTRDKTLSIGPRNAVFWKTRVSEWAFSILKRAFSPI